MITKITEGKGSSTDWDSLQDGLSYGYGKMKYAHLAVGEKTTIAGGDVSKVSYYPDAILFQLNARASYLSIKKEHFSSWENLQTSKEDIFKVYTKNNLMYLISKELD